MPDMTSSTQAGPTGRSAGQRAQEIRILLASYNGAAHLPAQLQSFAAQSYDHWSLRVGDDASRDDTLDQIQAFAAAHPTRDIAISRGPGSGPAANFLTLLHQAVHEAPEAALAFSDQDDVWLPHKLERAAAWLQAHGSDAGAPLVWVCRTVLTDADLAPQGESRIFTRPPSFGNALVQNILAGNTIVLSPAAARAVARTVPAALAAGVPYHDWWVYQVVTGMGGRVGMEPDPLVLYRQHGRNQLGHHGPVRGRFMRLGIVARRDYSGWISANLEALAANLDLLTRENRTALKGFARMRGRKGRQLAAMLPRLGLYRQTPQGDRMLRMMALSGRL